MAREYKMTPDTREKEKVVGGIFDLSQFMWVILGFGLFLIIGISLYRLIGFFSFILGFPFFVAGFVFAIKKVEDMPYFTYLRYKHKFKHKTKNYFNVGYHESLDFSDK